MWSSVPESKIYIVNSGWTGGPYGVGKRIDIPVTRAVIKAIQNGSIREEGTQKLDTLNVEVPSSLDGLDTKLLNPSETWSNKEDYNSAAKELSLKFKEKIDNLQETFQIEEVWHLAANSDIPAGVEDMICLLYTSDAADE